MSAGRFKLAEAKTVVVVGLIGAICGILSLLLLWSSPWKYAVALAIVAVSCFALLYEMEWRHLSLFRTGIVEYRKSFEPKDNAEIFPLVEKEYGYLGVSFLTASEHFCAWYSDRHPTQFRARILLANPEAEELLRFQQIYREGRTQDAGASDADGCEERSRVITSLHMLASLQAASEYIEVRFHREKLHEWLHIIDDRLICAGLLEFGESGRSCPLLVLKKKRLGVYGSYKAWFENLWETAEKVDLNSWRRSVVRAE